MKIVVECSCQVPYEFEIEPVDGQMPGTVACPTCGADGTEYANWVIQETHAREQSTESKIGLRHSDAAGEPTAEASSPVEGAETTDDDAGPGLPKFCHIHKDQPTEAFCLACKKPICLRCMKQSGYFCGPYCRNRAEQEGMEIPVYEGQERLVRAREYKNVTRLGTAIILVLIALFVTYEWYQLYGQHPSVKFSMPLANDERLMHAQFVSGHELLFVNPDKISVYDFKKKQPVWSKSLASYRPASPPTPSPTETADEAEATAKPTIPLTGPALAAEKLKQAAKLVAYEDYFDSGVNVRVIGDDIWVTLGRNVICLDRTTGAEKTKAQVDGRIQDTTFADNAMVIVSRKGPYEYVLTRVELPAGTPQTEQRSLPPPPPQPARTFDPDAPVEAGPSIPDERREFVAAGSTVADLDVKLVEKKMLTVETMKAPKTGQFDEGIKVTQTREMAEDVFNEMKRNRTGGVARVDQSRYAVTLQRVFGKDAASWTGEVVGPLAFFALKTVDVLVADKVMYVFSKTDQLMWQSNLSYPIAPQFRERESWWGGERDSIPAPCLEKGDTLYFFDQGVLTAFETKSGKARWRMPSVGVSRIQFDDQGMLYVTTTSAGPETIKYYEQVSMDRVEPIIVKVDPATGRALWHLEKVGDDCHLSGKYVYLTKSQVSGIDVIASLSHSGAGVPTHFRLYRLNPNNGKKLWECYRPNHPSQIDFHENEFLLQFGDKLEVLKFLSL